MARFKETGKRKTPENDDIHRNEKKRIKLNRINEDNFDHAHNNYHINPHHINDASKTSIKVQLKQTLDTINSIFASAECTSSEVKSFTDTLVSISTEHQNKVKELEYREKAVREFLNRYQKEINCQEKLYNFAQTMIKEFRYRKKYKWEDIDYNAITHYENYSIDIALKTIHPHREYIERMYTLMNNHIDGINDICSIICGYSHNGYKWYRMKLSISTDEDELDVEALNSDGILFSLNFADSDYFMDNGYYRKFDDQEIMYTRTINTSRVTFDSLWEELDTDELDDITDEEFSCFIVSIASWALYCDALEGCEEWIQTLLNR